MRIDLGDGYVLCSDPLNVWIVKVQTAEESGREYDRVVSGYYNNIQELIANFIDRKINTSEAESIKGLAKDINKLKRSVKAWKHAVSLDTLRQMDGEKA